MKRRNETFFKIEGKNLRFLPRPGLWGWIAIGILVFSLAANVYFYLSWKDCDSIEIIRERTDTIYKTQTVKYDTIIPDEPDIVAPYESATDSKSIDSTQDRLNDRIIRPLPQLPPDTLRTYTGSAIRDSVKVNYTITTTGILKRIILNASYPEKTINTRVSYEKKKQNAIYVNATTDMIAEMQNVKLGATYVRRRWLFSYNYGLLFNQHTIGVGYRIIEW